MGRWHPAYTVTDPMAPRKAVDRPLGRLADTIAADTRARTPVRTGTLRSGWRVRRGRFPAVRIISNPVPYTALVEYGTRRRAARPMIGPVIAAVRARQGVR
jgi:hypothetical protein